MQTKVIGVRLTIDEVQLIEKYCADNSTTVKQLLLDTCTVGVNKPSDNNVFSSVPADKASAYKAICEANNTDALGLLNMLFSQSKQAMILNIKKLYIWK